MSWNTFGHNKVKNILEKQIASGRIPHAYLFLGPKHLGKHALALEFAGKILQAEDAVKHPDFLSINEEGEIPVEKVRELIASVNLRPIAGKKKVVVINNAENLNKSGANALLKTLEEPGESTVIILIAAKRPLPTIISRCQKFSFNPFSRKMAEDFLIVLGQKFNTEVIELGFGLPGRLKKLSEDPQFLESERESFQKLERMQKLGEGERILQIGKYAEVEIPELQSMLLSWVMRLYFRARGSALNANLIPLQAAADALRQIGLNQNKKLILQNLFLKL